MEKSQGLNSHTDLLILAALDEGPAHGYEIAQKVKRRSDGLLRMKEGTLYPLLHRMEAEGLLRAAWRESDKGPARRTYELTAKGKKAFSRRAAEWRRLSAGVNAVVGEAARG
jgi:PadR family transcriptional regulator PadR